jgi:CRISPR/Cas system CSM-associated protein Csm3 (group 7 of RAMP superfamily)
MKHFELILRFPGSAPLVGGHTGDAGGAHVGHATDERGRPVLPSTAIRGALRATLEALCRGAGKPACTGGDGRPPDELPAPATDAAPGTTSDTAERETDSPRCTLDHGDRCLPCRLFGSQRASLDAGETAFSALVLESACLVSEDQGWQLRPGVAVSRTHRSAHDKALVFQRVPAGTDLCFVARGRLRVPALAAPFEAAVRATLHIGAGRSRGLGRVDMDLRWQKPETGPAAAPAPDSIARDVYVRAVLQTPAALGVAVVERNFLDARREIPGSTVRGAVGFALAELVPAVGDDPAFRALVAEVPDMSPDGANIDAGGAHFGFLYPVDGAEPFIGASDPDKRPIIGPLPITAQACKRERRAHGIRDTLIDRLTLALADTAERAERAGAEATRQCPECGGPLRSITGSRRASGSPRTRAVTRVALDRSRGSARDEQLFTQMRIEAGTHFEGTIRNVPEVARERLAQALGSGLLSVGRGRAAGWGTLEITAVAPANGSGGPLRARGAAFETALRQRLQACGMNAAPADRLVPVTLLAPLVPTREDDPDGAGLLVETLGGRACALRLRRFTREGGWDQQQGVMRMCWAVTAGSVFVIELPEGTRWHDIVPRLEALERDGVGARRHQGSGQVLCFDPFFLEPSTLASEAQRSSRLLTSHRSRAT